MGKSAIPEKTEDSPSPYDITSLISEEEERTDECIEGLRRVIPKLLRYALQIRSQRAYSPTLSSFFKLNGKNGSPLEVCYIVQSGDICALIDNPSSGFIDSEDNRLKKVSEEEFLKWVNEDPLRVLDVYRHLRDYIREKPQEPVRVPRDHF